MPGVILSTVSLADITEAGGQATFTVRLGTAPESDVILDVESEQPGVAGVSPARIVLGPMNWDMPQTVTVTAVDDQVLQPVQNGMPGKRNYRLQTLNTVSADPRYNDLNPADVVGSTVDDEALEIRVTPSTMLTASEDGMVTATVSVRLGAPPMGTVTVDVSDDAGQATASPPSLVFTAMDWSTPRDVNIKAVDDDMDDDDAVGALEFAVAVGSSAEYLAAPPVTRDVTCTDNDVAALVISPREGLTTSEAGGLANFSVALATRPAGQVTVTVEALPDGMVQKGTVLAGASLVFNNTDWSTALTVVLHGVDQDVANPSTMANTPYMVRLTAASTVDNTYNALSPEELQVTHLDTDVPGFSVTWEVASVLEGNAATLRVQANTAPAAAVTVNISAPSGSGTAPASIMVPAGSLDVHTATFTPTNDNVAGVARTVQLTLSSTSTDSAYNLGQAMISVPQLEVTDDDVAGVTVTPSVASIPETGATSSFTVSVVLTAVPAGVSVTVPVSITPSYKAVFAGAGGSASSVNVMFTAANALMPQVFTVNRLDDKRDDDGAVLVITANPSSSGNATEPFNVAPTVTAQVAVTGDDDVAGYTFSKESVFTAETGLTDLFTVRLTSQPASTVTVTLVSSDTAEATLSTGSLSFGSMDWNTARSVTVSGKSDAVVDGRASYTINTGVTSSDTQYAALDPPNVTGINEGDYVVFFSEDTYTGNLGGISGADTRCGDTRYFKALIAGGGRVPATSTSTGTDWPIRAHATYKYGVERGTPTVTAFVAGANGVLPGSPNAQTLELRLWWSGLTDQDTAATETCLGWTSALDTRTGAVGRISLQTTYWDTGTRSPCNERRSLMCVQYR